ncbi:hypothetical protein MCEMKE14_00073 [Candidatus Nanopelagicaceae bacterium]
MAQIDPFDDSVLRYVIRRHQYDTETKHFRWIYEVAFDNKREYEKKFEKAFNELEARRLKGDAHFKEQLAGEELKIGYFKNSKIRRQRRAEEGRMYLASPRNRVVFLLLSHRIPFIRSRRIHKFLRGFLR